MKELTEFGGIPLKISIETQMFKYFHHYSFLKKNSYFSPALHGEIQLEN